MACHARVPRHDALSPRGVSQHIESESEMAPMLFALKMVMMQVMAFEGDREVARLEDAGECLSPTGRAAHLATRSRSQSLPLMPSRYLGSDDGSDEGGDGDGAGLKEQLTSLREMVLEERRLAREERARAGEVGGARRLVSLCLPACL